MSENYYGKDKMYCLLENYITNSFTMVEKRSLNLVPLPINMGYARKKQHMIKAHTSNE